MPALSIVCHQTNNKKQESSFEAVRLYFVSGPHAQGISVSDVVFFQVRILIESICVITKYRLKQLLLAGPL